MVVNQEGKAMSVKELSDLKEQLMGQNPLLESFLNRTRGKVTSPAGYAVHYMWNRIFNEATPEPKPQMPAGWTEFEAIIWATPPDVVYGWMLKDFENYRTQYTLGMLYLRDFAGFPGGNIEDFAPVMDALSRLDTSLMLESVVKDYEEKCRVFAAIAALEGRALQGGVGVDADCYRGFLHGLLKARNMAASAPSLKAAIDPIKQSAEEHWAIMQTTSYRGDSIFHKGAADGHVEVLDAIKHITTETEEPLNDGTGTPSQGNGLGGEQ